MTVAITASLARPVFGFGQTAGTQGEDYITLAREALVRFFHADPKEHWVFTHNATDALNILIPGFIAGMEAESLSCDHDRTGP